MSGKISKIIRFIILTTKMRHHSQGATHIQHLDLGKEDSSQELGFSRYKLINQKTNHRVVSLTHRDSGIWTGFNLHMSFFAPKDPKLREKLLQEIDIKRK